MATPENIRSSFGKLHEKIRSAKEISEEDLRIAFVRSGILEVLGYEGELTDIRFEKNVRGKRSDLIAFDEYQNVVFVVEFKKPKELDVERDFAQLWGRYVKPLKARYGLLTDGLELMIYERINSNWERKLSVNLGALALQQCEDLYEWLRKPRIERTKIEAVLSYFAQFDDPAERVNLSSEIAQKHFFESFELKAGSSFANLVEKTIGLFDFELERSKFLKSAYNFWKVSYAKKPEKIPENWRRIMAGMGLEATEENLFKFMFCLESAYSLFTRLILAKACEDYKLPYVEFSRFIKTEIEQTSYRGDITLLAWAITTKHLIESMKQRLVKSVFEGDIFYWWEDSYRDISAGDALYSPRFEKQKGRFGEALAEIILTLYKYDFSAIVGDPLGTLYQRYFDKETRKALGEFYTPQEVVEYILDAVGYEGRGIIGKRLLDPACGSGTFLVEALRRYLKASEQIADEKGWSKILEELCNEYRIVGFDIHPFATFMAQMQFMLVLIPVYKRAMDEDRRFVLSRLPIFRTDSLIDETKGETKKVTLETFEEGIQYLLIDTGLPVEGGNLKIKMPYRNVVTSKTDLYDVQEYFAALQAVFDTVKDAAWRENYEVDTNELERNFKRYLEDKNWSGLVSFFTPYAERFLQKFKELKETFGDGKLIKSLEDIMLAAVLKNYVQYDFVVGNPPYVRIHLLEEQKKHYRRLYKTAHGKFDIYVPFLERGINWLNSEGLIGYICSNQFLSREYGKELKKFILAETEIKQIIDFRDSGVFKDATNYPCIIVFQRNRESRKVSTFKFVRVRAPREGILSDIEENFKKERYQGDFYDSFIQAQSDLIDEIWDIMPDEEKSTFNKIKNATEDTLDTLCKIFTGVQTGADKIFLLTKENKNSIKIENDLLKPFLKGVDVRRWKINWGGLYLIFPHRQENDELINIAESELKNQYIKTFQYLETFKEKLSSRKWFDKSPTDIYGEWFALMYFAKPDMFENFKLLTPAISNKNNFAFDSKGYYFPVGGGTIYGISLFSDISSEKDYFYLLGILNSNTIEFYFKHISSVLSGGYYEYHSQYLGRFPIRLPQTPEEQTFADRITNHVEQILEQVKLEQNIENFPGDYIRKFRNKGEEFDPKNVSFKSNHKILEPVITEDIEGQGYNVIPSKKETPLFVDSKLKADYVVAALNGKRAKKDEKLQLLVPKSDTVIEAILKELEEDKATVTSPSVTELEAEINELVYELYGLTEEDIKVIEDFLRRF